MKPDYEDEIRAENALLKLKLELDHGMEASHVSEEVSPAVENVWLNSILKFEKQWKKSKPVTVFQHVGRPNFKKLESMALSDVRNETKRLLDLMRKKNIIVEHVQPVDDIEYYRFITEELLQQEIFSVPGSNMIFHFIYDEFRNNGMDQS